MTASTRPDIVVRAGRPDEVGRIGAVLADAFRDDPVISWVVRDDEQAAAARLSFFSGYAAEEFEHVDGCRSPSAGARCRRRHSGSSHRGANPR